MVQEANKDDRISNGIPKISHLPEPVLVHILSFLRIRDAGRTSVLSKEWRFLWKYIPILIFDEFEKETFFKDRIDRVLLLHGSSAIKVFYLRCYRLGAEDHSRLNGWVSNVASHNVQECTLDLLDIEKDETFWLHYSLFTCNTLVELNVKFAAPTTLNLPSEIHLPNLKVLSLENAIILNESSIQQLFSSPSLERLLVSGNNWESIGAVRISAPKLKHLTIIEPVLLDDGPEDILCQVMICNCNLEYFELSGCCIVNEYLISNVSAIYVNISIKFRTGKRAAHLLNRFLHGISGVQNLHLDGSTVEILSDAPELFSAWSDSPAFKALNTLQLAYLNAVTIKCGVFEKILRSTPHLHTLRLHETAKYLYVGKDEDDHDVGEIFNLVPPCFFSSLKKVIMDFTTLIREPNISKPILKYATVLEEFIISDEAVIRMHDATWDSFCKKLMACPRGSKNCKFIF